MPVLAMSAGKVSAIWGSAYVRSPDGNLRVLHVGDKVAGGDHIVTTDDGIVEISPLKGPAVLVKAIPAQVVDRSIAGIEAQDPNDVPAAGLQGGDGGLLPGLRVDRVSESVGPTSFAFGDTARAAATPAALVSPLERNVQPADATGTAPGGPDATSPQLRLNDVTVNEGAGNATFTVTLDKPATGVVTVSFATGHEGDTAVATGDYLSRAGTVTFQPGETSKTISVPLINDAIYEGSERFTVTLSNPANAVIAKDTGVGVILDNGQGDVPAGTTPDDDRPTVVSVSDASTTEGGPLSFHVTLSHASTTDTRVYLDVLPGDAHAATPGADTGAIQVFLGDGPLPLTLQTDEQGRAYVVVPALTPADVPLTVLVPTVADHTPEGIESIRLSVATEHDTTAHNGIGTIDDRPYLLVQNGEPAVEGQPVEFNVVLTHASDKPVTIKLALLDGSDDPGTPGNEAAIVGTDTGTQLEYRDGQGHWRPVTSELTFQPGDTQIVVRVATVDDGIVEPTEYVKLQATVTSGDTVNDVHANQTAITDNDLPYMLVQSGEPAVEGQPVVFDVVLTQASPGAVTVKLALASGVDDPTTPENESATLGTDTGTQLEVLDAQGHWVSLGADPQVTFAPGQTLVQVRVATVDDHLAEDVEFIKLQGTVVSGETANQTHANQTAIVDNDTVPGVLQPIHAEVSALDTNLMVVLDTSGSMDDASGIANLSRLQAAVQAIDKLIDRYDQAGDVAVRLVTFSSDTHVHGDAWLSAADAKQVLAALSTGGGSTNYDYALDAARAAFDTAAGKLDNAQNVAYFLSDGNPTLSSLLPQAGIDGQSGNLTQVGKGDGIDAGEQAAWQHFLDAHQIKSYAIGMGDEVSPTFLDPIAYDGHASSDTSAVPVASFGDLDGVLHGTTQDFVQGNLSAQGSIGQAGDAFQHVDSVTVDGVQHDWNAAQPLLQLTTALGGQLHIDMATGAYSYAAPSAGGTDVQAEHIGFTLRDQQGGTGSSTLDIRFDHTHVTVGGDAGETLTGGVTADLILGRDGADTVSADGGNDALYGNGGADELHGGAGADLLIGGQGSDTLFGDAGSDVFAWRLSDAGASGSAADRAVDVVKDFDSALPVNQGDVLDLRDLLQGEHAGPGGDIGNLDHYLDIAFDGQDTLIHVAPKGDMTPPGAGGSGSGAGTQTQTIVLQGVDLHAGLGLDAAATSQQVIGRLVEQGKLLVDHA